MKSHIEEIESFVIQEFKTFKNMIKAEIEYEKSTIRKDDIPNTDNK